MTMANAVIYDGLQRQAGRGDLVLSTFPTPVANASITQTITAGILLLGYWLRTSGATTDTFDSAANIVAGLNASSNGQLQNGSTFIWRSINTGGGTQTIQATANTGVTVTRGTLATATFKDFLVNIVNATPAQVYACTTTSGSAVLGMTPAQAATLSVGMVVTNAVANLQGQTIIAINISSGQVTMSGNANATNAAPGVAVNFSPVITVDGLSGV